MADRTCSINGCEKKVFGHGWCNTHYCRWRRHGDPNWVGRTTTSKQELAARAAAAPDGQKWCSTCRVYRSREEFHRNAAAGDGLTFECKSCGAARSSVWKRRNPAKVATWRSDNADRVRQYQKKSRDRRQAEGRSYPSNRRVRLRQGVWETFTRIEIADRDLWRCGICGNRIGRTLVWPHPRSLSIDHIVPVVHGGEHLRSNVQASHLVCNLRKRDGGTDQLRLL